MIQVRRGYIYLVINDDKEVWFYSTLPEDKILINRYDCFIPSEDPKIDVWEETEWDIEDLNKWLSTGNRMYKITRVHELTKEEYDNFDLDKFIKKIKMMWSLES